MRDIFNVFFGFGDRREKKVYNLVNTNDTFPGANNPYNTTTTTMMNESKETNRHSESIKAAVVVDRILFKGKLSLEENKTRCVLVTVFLGLLCISLGALILVFSPHDFIFRMKTTFTEGAEGFEMWSTPPAKVYLKVYIFNITNKDAFLSGKEKLRVQEVGPYVYRELGVHADNKFNPNGTITSVPKYPLEWVPEMNAGKEDDILVLPNIALLSFASVISKQNFLTRLAVNALIAQTNSQPIVEQTAKEFMFGYESALVTLGNTFIPGWISFDKLGLIDRMYDFTGDVETTYSGETDLHLSGLLDTYNHLPYLPQWEAPCNALRGASDGTKFPTGIANNEPLRFFRKALCRSIPMVRNGEKPTTMHGISAVRYKFEDNAFDNGEINAENKCFCYRGKCMRRGLLDVEYCYYGFPIALSYPHFYMGDHTLREDILGTTPSQDEHETYFYLNPETGTPTKVSVKIQINMVLSDLRSMDRCGKFSNLVVPLVWTDITMPELNFMLKAKLFLLTRVSPIVETLSLYLFLIGGVAFILLSLSAMLFISTVKTAPAQRSNIVKKSQQVQQSQQPINSAINRTEYMETSEKSVEANKEMEMYYCSLLVSNSDESQ